MKTFPRQNQMRYPVLINTRCGFNFTMTGFENAEHPLKAVKFVGSLERAIDERN